jgi:hypothetical protein
VQKVMISSGKADGRYLAGKTVIFALGTKIMVSRQYL